MWFDSIAGTNGLASTAGPSAVTPGTPSPVGRAVAVVLGYWYPGDGGGGMFYWDASSEANPDGGTVFAIPCHPRGRWIRLVEGPVSVKWFGAKVDGEHNDREAVQAALNCGPGVVFIPAGRCAIYDAPVSIPARTTLIGAGSGATTLQQCTAGQEVVRIIDAPNASLVGLAVISSGAAHAVHAAAVSSLDPVEHVTLRDVWVQPGFGSPGISVTGVDQNALLAPGHGLSDGQIVQLSAGSQSLGVGVDVAFSSDGTTVSTGSTPHGLQAGDPVQFIDVEDANAVPAELSAQPRYYVVNPTATTFQVAAARGGSPISFTGGTGSPVTVYVWPMVPGGLQPYLEYFVVYATADTFELSVTPGGTPITITDAPASTCKVGVVYAGILLESAGKNLYSPRIRDCKVDGGQDYTDGGARHGIRAITTSPGGSVVGATVIGGETANVKAGMSAILAEIIAVAHHVFNTVDGSGGGAAFAASGNNALQGSDNRIESGPPAAERAVLFYPQATGCSLRATPSFQAWQILDLNGGNSWWLALDSNVENQQMGFFSFNVARLDAVGFYHTPPQTVQPTSQNGDVKASGTYGTTEQNMLNDAYQAARDVGLLT